MDNEAGWNKSLFNLMNFVNEQRPEGARIKDPGVAEKPDSRRRQLMFGAVATALHFGSRYADTHGVGLTQAASMIHAGPGSAGGMIRKRSEQMAAGFNGFFTDFTEQDPLKLWKVFDPGGLVVERFQDRMSAVPSGPCLLRPANGMTDGVAAFHFLADGKEAGFIFRGQDHRDHYLARINSTRRLLEPKLTLTIAKRRKGLERLIKQIEIGDPNLARLSVHRLSISMDGNTFAAHLQHWQQGPFGDVLNSTTVASWKDTSFAQGSVGALGPKTDGMDRGKGFRVFSVKLDTQKG